MVFILYLAQHCTYRGYVSIPRRPRQKHSPRSLKTTGYLFTSPSLQRDHLTIYFPSFLPRHQPSNDLIHLHKSPEKGVLRHQWTGNLRIKGREHLLPPATRPSARRPPWLPYHAGARLWVHWHRPSSLPRPSPPRATTMSTICLALPREIWSRCMLGECTRALPAPCLCLELRSRRSWC